MINNVSLDLFYAECLSFETFDKPYDEDEKAILSSNFDYDTLFDGTKRVYIDIGMKFSNSKILFRSGFEFDGREMNWDEVFDYDFINKLINRAFEISSDEYCRICEERNIPFTVVKNLNENLAATMTKGIIKQYTEYRSVSDKENEYLINTVGLECEPGNESIALLKCTFLILDEILINHPSFNNEYNRDAFSDYIPMPKYYTLRFNCLLIEYNEVQISFYDTILFYHCLDCALQMLVGDKSDIIIEAIEKKGIDKKMQQLFIESGTEFFGQLREMLINSNARILNLETHVDWNSLIH